MTVQKLRAFSFKQSKSIQSSAQSHAFGTDSYTSFHKYIDVEKFLSLADGSLADKNLFVVKRYAWKFWLATVIIISILSRSCVGLPVSLILQRIKFILYHWLKYTSRNSTKRCIILSLQAERRSNKPMQESQQIYTDIHTDIR